VSVPNPFRSLGIHAKRPGHTQILEIGDMYEPFSAKLRVPRFRKQGIYPLRTTSRFASLRKGGWPQRCAASSMALTMRSVMAS
jgi:hypothetical protein